MNVIKAILKNIVIKYRQLVGSFIFLCYLSIFTLNLFHIHKYDFNNISEIDFTNKSSQHVQVSKSQFECIVHLNLLSLQTASTNFSFSNLLLNPNQNFDSPGENKNNFCSIYLSHNFLRAPPRQSIKD
jgi:hypothetical protein